jgi:hypothetical protein
MVSEIFNDGGEPASPNPNHGDTMNERPQEKYPVLRKMISEGCADFADGFQNTPLRIDVQDYPFDHYGRDRAMHQGAVLNWWCSKLPEAFGALEVLCHEAARASLREDSYLRQLIFLRDDGVISQEKFESILDAVEEDSL